MVVVMGAQYEHCRVYGFDQRRLRDRLAQLGLEQGDHDDVRALHAIVIEPRVGLLVERFYGQMQQLARFREILERGYDLDSLKRTQAGYLSGLGCDFDTAAYFEQRLAVGLAHARAGVPLSLYEAAYLHLRRILIDEIRQRVDDLDRRDRLVDVVLKVTALDMSLATETYHVTRMHVLEDSLGELEAEQLDLRRRIQTDPLTEVTSRERLLEILADALQHCCGTQGRPLCLAMVDLDFFKQVNDQYGHLTGDAVLRDVTARIRSALRDFDVVGRYGGEEFIVVLQNTSLPRARTICERVRKRVASAPFKVEGIRIPMTISLGLTQARAGDRVDLLVDRADHAMYAAKDAGRNCLVVNDEPAGD